MELGLATLPGSISLFVIVIGILGIVSALFARVGIGGELKALKKGRDALHDYPVGTIPDYSGWLSERRLKNTHFEDHLLAAWNANRSGRSVTLNELHEVSARREARRKSAGLSGGVTGLLLVCGIAGTLFCIKPILGNFNVNANPDGVFEAAESAQRATLLMQELSQGFWPSLCALVLTVIVVFFRGLYTYKRGVLAGELDRFDIEVLFLRFPPPSLSKEFDEVRASLEKLVSRMLASQQNFDGFVNRLEGASQNFNKQAPPLHDASTRFVEVIMSLEPKIDELLKALEGHLGADGPLCMRLGSLDTLAHQVTTIAEDMKQTGSMMTGQLHSSQKILQETAKGLPAHLTKACNSATTILKEATVHAVGAACADAARSLDEAAGTVRDTAAAINSSDQALRNDISKGIKEITADTRKQTKMMKKEFQDQLKSTVREMATIQATTSKAISGVDTSIRKLEEMQVVAKQALGEYAQGRKETAQVSTDLQLAVERAEKIERQMHEATEKLLNSQEESSMIAKRLGGIIPKIDVLSTTSRDLKTEISELKKAQSAATQQFDEAVGRAEKIVDNWKAVLFSMNKHMQDGATLDSNLSQFLIKGEELANVLNDELMRLADKNNSSWIGRIFRDLR